MAATLFASLAGAVGAGATTTLDETIKVRNVNGFKILSTGPGEPFVVREAGLGHAKRNRAKKRRSKSSIT